MRGASQRFNAMSPFTEAVRRFISEITCDDRTLETSHEILNDAIDWIESASASEKTRSLDQIAGLLARTDLSRAALVALACGAIVEQGGDPTIAVDAILARLQTALIDLATSRAEAP